MKNDILTKVGEKANKASFKLQKHSPEILLAAGVIGTVASAVLACRATLKVNDILENHNDTVDTIHGVLENEEISEEEYTVEDSKKDLTMVYVHTGVNLAKAYAPAVVLGAASVASILASHNILKKRNVAIAAAYATIDESFKAYRKRVVERFGEEVDRELKYNLKAEKFDKTIVDEETGKKKKVKETGFVVTPSDISGYARFFEKYTTNEDGVSVINPNWKENNEYNLMFLKAQERYANDLLKAKGRLFLNEVYEMLGLPISKAGQVVGWVYNTKNPVGDNYVDFGLYSDNLSYADFVEGRDPAILLDFNVDGNIWELM